MAGLEAEVPLVVGVFLVGEAGDLVEGERGQGVGGVPGFAEGGFKGVRGEVDVDEEVRVGAVEAIARLAGGQGEGFFDEAEVEVEEEGAVEEEAAAVAALGVAGELESANGEVGLALPLDGGHEERGQGVAEAFEDEAVGGGDAVEGAGVGDAEDQGVVEDAGALQDGAAAGAAAQDGDGVLLTEGEVGFGGGLVGVAEDNEVAGQGPEAEEFVALAGFAEVEEDLVAGEVFLGRREGEVAEVHVL